MQCLVRGEVSFNTETRCFMKYDSVAVQALLPPLLSADPSGTALLYYGLQMFPWAVLFPLSISNMNSILVSFHIEAFFFCQRPLY